MRGGAGGCWPLPEGRCRRAGWTGRRRCFSAPRVVGCRSEAATTAPGVSRRRTAARARAVTQSGRVRDLADRRWTAAGTRAIEGVEDVCIVERPARRIDPLEDVAHDAFVVAADDVGGNPVLALEGLPPQRPGQVDRSRLCWTARGRRSFHWRRQPATARAGPSGLPTGRQSNERSANLPQRRTRPARSPRSPGNRLQPPAAVQSA